jgi:hypothetical protein
VDIGVDRARWRTTLNYRVLPRLNLGVELNPGEAEVGPLVTWFLVTERGARPGVFLGTSSDRIGTPAGEQSYYATATRSLPGLPLSAYVTLNYSEFDDGLNVPFGAELDLADTLPVALSLRGMYDGERSHAMLTHAREHWAASLLLVWLERPGISVALGF